MVDEPTHGARVPWQEAAHRWVTDTLLRIERGRLVVVDIPLLYESGLDKRFDFEEIVVVYVPREVQLERLMKRDGLTTEAAEQRLDAQMPIERKKELADVVIDNSGTLEQTEAQVDAYLRRKGCL